MYCQPRLTQLLALLRVVRGGHALRGQEGDGWFSQRKLDRIREHPRKKRSPSAIPLAKIWTGGTGLRPAVDGVGVFSAGTARTRENDFHIGKHRPTLPLLCDGAMVGGRGNGVSFWG